MRFAREIRLAEGVRKELASACAGRWPEETCGIIYGRRYGGSLEAEGFSVVRNVSREPQKAFAFDPDDWVQAFYDAQRNRRRIVGFFHSHPNGSLVPSTEDTAGWLPWGTYWIVAVTAGGICEFAVYEPDAEGRWAQCLLK